MIRAARVEDFGDLQAIEVAAGKAFADVGYPDVAGDEPFSEIELEAFRAAGRMWVATDDDDAIVGYVVGREVGGRGHVEQVSVRPEAQGHGYGRALVAQVEHWARGHGFDTVTLSTFRDVPWNAPLYAHLGYRVLAEDELDDVLLAERAHERTEGLPVEDRVFMRRDLED